MRMLPILPTVDFNLCENLAEKILDNIQKYGVIDENSLTNFTIGLASLLKAGIEPGDNVKDLMAFVRIEFARRHESLPGFDIGAINGMLLFKEAMCSIY